ncbi:hypothetical protein [Nostoc sp. FACHB-888]|uniref:hypothetical protein n=1 Tax=Nostoc sp. FACHB-888 TaxID=2692842 RepID=UPI00321FF587
MPQADLQTNEAKSIQALRESYLRVELAKYQVRKFPHFWVKDYSHLVDKQLTSVIGNSEAIATKTYRNST